MSDKQVVLVTGVGSYWGTRLAGRLTAEPELHVIGLDSSPRQQTVQGLDYIQADVRNPLLVDLLRDEAVNAVCHLAFVEDPPDGEAAFDLNVIGTMKLLAACGAAGVRRVVLRSSTMVYGARPDNSAFLREDHPLRADAGNTSLRHLMEIEALCNGYRRQAPHMDITVLRFPGIIGPTADTPMTRFLGPMYTPVLLGFDPMMQVIHEDDVVEALAHALLSPVSGTFNVAAEGVLPLSKLLAIAGKPPVPVMCAAVYWGNNLLNSFGVSVRRFWPIPPDYLRYPWVGDLEKMREELGFVPKYTAEEALREFAGRRRLQQYLFGGDDLSYDEERLRDTLERRRRAREAGRSAAAAQAAGLPEELAEAQEEEEETA